MAVSALQLDCNRLPSSALTAGLSPVDVECWKEELKVVHGLPQNGRFGAPGCRAVVWCAEGEEEGMARETQQAWQRLFSNPTQWWDNRRSVGTPPHPDFVHMKSKEALWLINWYKHPSVESQLGMWDVQMASGMWRPPKDRSGRVGLYEGGLELGACRKLCDDGLVEEAVDGLNVLVQQGCDIPNNLFYRILKRCITGKNLVLGRRVHALTVESGYEGDAFLATHLIGLYASQGMLGEAMRVFSIVKQPSAYNWASIILACARHGEPTQAMGLYLQMHESTAKPDNAIFVAVLTACASARDLAAGKDVHAHIRASAVKPDIFVQTSLVDMYAKCGSLEDARRVFDGLPQKDVVVWNALIAGYVQQGMGQEALRLYSTMQQERRFRPSSVTFVCILQACAGVGVAALHQGKQLHAQIKQLGVQADMAVSASLVNMYSKCGSLDDARIVFDRLPHKDVVTWNAMIAGYAQQGMGEEAQSLYSRMQQEGTTIPDSVTFVCLLQACASVAALPLGKQLHAQIEAHGLQDDAIVNASLITMYTKCGALEDAQRIFDRLAQKDVVTWNAMITGYAQQGMGQEALTLYSAMQQEGITPPNTVTFLCLLQACASVAALPLGKQLHAQIEERELQDDMAVGPSLVNMYAKCGSLEDAQQVFDSLPRREISAWGALIAGYARQGDSETVFDLVHRMRQEGIQLNGITCLSVLTVCSHVGLVDEGQKYFEAMSTEYGVSPTIEHYTCMVDLLGRAGRLDDALAMAKAMPFQPDGRVWRTLLGACRKWKNVEVGRQTFEFAVRLDEKDAAAYVLMSNIYAAAYMWEKAKEVQARRVKYGALKEPGRSWWTDMRGVVHSFVAGDKSHPESEGVYARLERTLVRMKKEGYVPHLASSLQDIADDEKEVGLCGHSEKLAIAYALNKTPEGTTIRVVKNLRVCEDCHTATAYISKLEKRTIICRDASRFHVFKDGKCSCGDFW